MLVVAAVVAITGAAGYWFLTTEPDAPAQPALTAEAKNYVSNLQLSEVEMKATESYLKQAVVEIEGKVTNQGARLVKLVEVNCVFRDAYGQVVLRERVTVAGRRSGDLPPGQVKNFRIAFDSITESWNRALPDLVIAQILFG